MILQDIILIIIAAVFLIWLISHLIYRTISKRVGDCAIDWIDGYLQVEEPEYDGDFKAKIKFAMPIKSIGKQQCLMIDMIGRIQPEGDKYCSIDPCVYVYPGGNKRRDNYWEATLIKPADTLIIKGEVAILSKDKPVKQVLADMRYMGIALYYKYYCRNLMEHKRKIVTLDFTRFSGLPAPAEVVPSQDLSDLEGRKAVPVRTPLLRPGDSIYEIFDKYARKYCDENDILAICESALAIMEGRAYYVEDIKPGFLAVHLCKLFKMDSSLSSPYSLEMAIREVGAFKIITSIIIGVLGKLIGRAGEFYAFAGRAVATIDDCTGTLPPFDKYVVMGPKDPKTSAAHFKKRTGFDMTVVDVNDLGKVDVLALTDPGAKDIVVEALRKNPQGNANEQMPIAIVKRKKEESVGL